MAPPRVLSVPYILGRPLGVPGDADFQHRVLDAALALLERTDGPVFEEYTEEAPGISADEEAWVCPVSFSKDKLESSLADDVKSEMGLLKPWYDKGLAARGSTTVGLSSMSLEAIVDYIEQFLSDGPPDDENASEQLKQAAEDLKAFYNEAAVSQPGSSSAKAIEDWYWRESAAGKLIQAVKAACYESENAQLKITARLLLVPHSQSRD